MAHIFISYATPDRRVADEVSGWLREAGHEPFLDDDLRDGISVGEDWKQRLYRELREVEAIHGYLPPPEQLAQIRLPCVVTAGTDNRDPAAAGHWRYEASQWLAA